MIAAFVYNLCTGKTVALKGPDSGGSCSRCRFNPQTGACFSATGTCVSSASRSFTESVADVMVPVANKS